MTELQALHAYRNQAQLELARLSGTLRGLAGEAADQLDKNNDATPFYAGQHAAYLAASRLCDRVLLVSEEAAGKSAAPAPSPADAPCGEHKPHPEPLDDARNEP